MASGVRVLVLLFALISCTSQAAAAVRGTFTLTSGNLSLQDDNMGLLTSSHRQLQGLSPFLSKFTGVRLQDTVRAQASVASARQLYDAYIQRMKRTDEIKRNWENLRKKDKATLMASFKDNEAALAEACLPDSWDSRSLGIVTPVKSQGNCGMCVAYALAAAAETAILISRKGSWNNFEGAAFDISEEQLYFCSNDRRTCSSGWDLRPALQHLESLSRQRQPVYTSGCVDYNPELLDDTSCTPKCQEAAPKGVFSWEPYDTQLNAQRGIVRYGGVLTYLWLTDGLTEFLFDKSKAKGIYKSQDTNGIMHAVFVVGYSNSGQYWIVKNSFSTDNGDGGYFNVGYGEAGIMEPDRIFGLRYAVDPNDDFARYAIVITRIPDSKNCYTYTTVKGDTLEWLSAKLGIRLSAIVADNKDTLQGGFALAPGTELKVCDVPSGRFKPGSVIVWGTYPQITPEGYVYIRLDKESATYWVMAVPVITYSMAESLCQKYGGRLATVNTWAEEWDVRSALGDLWGSGDPPFAFDLDVSVWIGYKKPNGKAWVDTEGRSENAWPTKWWFSDQPRDVGQFDQCALLRVTYGKGAKEEVAGWYSEACATENFVGFCPDGLVCKFPVTVAKPGKLVPTFDPNSDQSLPVKQGTTSKGDPYLEVKLESPASDKGTFRLVDLATTIDQDGANKYCLSTGGNLDSIHSKEALKVLHASYLPLREKVTVYSVWIGLHKAGRGKALQWFDGTPVDYTRWAYGSPGNDDVVQVALTLVSPYADAFYFVQNSAFSSYRLLCKL